jgi:hypothetical protein
MKSIILVVTILFSSLSFAETSCYDGKAQCTIAQMIAANNKKIEEIANLKKQISEVSDKGIAIVEYLGAWTIIVNNLFATAVTEKAQYTKKRITIMGVTLLVSAVLIYDGTTRLNLSSNQLEELKEKLEIKEKQLELENKILLNVYKQVEETELVVE